VTPCLLRASCRALMTDGDNVDAVAAVVGLEVV
jgi:hypothetical protein